MFTNYLLELGQLRSKAENRYSINSPFLPTIENRSKQILNQPNIYNVER